ncbi:hypothetical protein E2L08_12330 [Palleronia sediminis]|uniref:Uncharacterized protein n=1 Tax=Palleronia sediminis TaxID=2547833 RepID=A0A4R6A3B7_9RHOB|nr:hypothetical protein [Palleronia sediminis]TDL78080.1 hypothetical protein E2L08_12330 [Palleronia sediminis]
MKRFTITALGYLAANGIGLLLAALLLPGFVIAPLGFVVAVLLFTVVQAVAGPAVTSLARNNMPELLGGIALVTIFLGLFVTASLLPTMQIGGISNWLAATLLIWIGSLAAAMFLRRHFARTAPATRTAKG